MADDHYKTEKDKDLQQQHLTLAQKLKIKVDEILDKEKDLDPMAAERVGQIVNDAAASVPPEGPPPAEKPELAMARRMREQLEAAVAAGLISEGLAKKIEGLAKDIEAAYKEPAPAQPAAAPAAAKK
jgi:hypothetical protein